MLLWAGCPMKTRTRLDGGSARRWRTPTLVWLSANLQRLDKPLSLTRRRNCRRCRRPLQLRCHNDYTMILLIEAPLRLRTHAQGGVT